MSTLILIVFVLVVGLGLIIFAMFTHKTILWHKHVISPYAPPAKKARLVHGKQTEKVWNLKSIQSEFENIKTSVRIIENIPQKPPKSESLGGFFSYVGYSVLLIFKEKEIIAFALLQWAVIGAGYYLWVQILEWIPAEVWQSIDEHKHNYILNLLFFLWSFLCVGIVSFPLGILSACMGAAHFINRQGRSSTIAECLKMVLPKVWPIWVFTWTDSWITVGRILDRLPQKRDISYPFKKAFNEIMYYAWKVGTIGVLPGLITGRGLVESCRTSIDVVRKKFKEVVKLRLGYSFFCWIVGTSAYIGTILFFVYIHDPDPNHEGAAATIYSFYLWAGVPICIAVGVIQIFLRPIYMIAACHIYSDYLNENKKKIILPVPPSKGMSALVAFCALLFIVAIVFLYRDQLGITELLSTVYQ